MLAQRDATSFSWASESDIHGLVKETLQSVLKNMDLASKLTLHNELSVFEMRPDMWIVTSEGVPVGVVEVKKPDKNNKNTVLDHKNVFGQIYDYMMRLRSFFGLRYVFGIITTYAQWRVVWLDEPDTIVAAASAADQAMSLLDNRDVQKEDQASLLYEDDETKLEDAAVVDHSVNDTRKVVFTRVYDSNDADLYRLLGSAISKMFRSPKNAVKLIDSTRPYLCLEEESVYWTTVRFDNSKFRLRHGPLPTGNLLLLDDFRAGRMGACGERARKRVCSAWLSLRWTEAQRRSQIR